jgi:hypothetical protein
MTRARTSMALDAPTATPTRWGPLHFARITRDPMPWRLDQADRKA